MGGAEFSPRHGGGEQRCWPGKAGAGRLVLQTAHARGHRGSCALVLGRLGFGKDLCHDIPTSSGLSGLEPTLTLAAALGRFALLLEAVTG